MSLRTRIPAALAAAFLAAGVSPAADAPAAVAQSQPLGETLTLVRGLVKKYGGEDALAKFNDGLAKALGEKGYDGLDMTKPLRGYMVLTDDPQQPGGVVMLPVTGEKEFIALLKRTKLDVTPVKGAEGLYVLEPQDGGDAEKKVRLRFAGQHAYIGINLPDAELAASKLATPEQVTVPGRSGLFSLRSYIQRMPKGAMEQNKEQMEQAKGMLDGLPLPDDLKASLGKLLDTSVKFSERQYKEGDTYDVRVDLDPVTDDLTFDVILKAKPGTQLAKEIAGYKTPTNRFISLLTADTVVGFATRLPLFTPEIRETVVEAVKLGVASQEDKIPPPAKRLADEALAGVLRTIKSGGFDLGFALNGPLKGGGYSLTVGVSFEDTKGLEKETRDAIKDAPEGVENFVKLDAEKANGIGIHTVELTQFVPPEGKKFLGEKSSLAFAFAPKAIYVAVGEDAVARVKTGLAGKLEPAPVVKVVTNGKRLLKLMELNESNPLAPETKALFDKEDKLVTGLSMTLEGGEAFTTRVRLRAAAFFAAGAIGVKRQGKPVPLPAAPVPAAKIK
jgi:hypothetical protein